MSGTDITDGVSHNPAVEELRAIWDGLPCAQRADVFLSVSNLWQGEKDTRRRPNQISIAFKIEKYLSLTSLMSSLTRLAQIMSRASLVVW